MAPAASTFNDSAPASTDIVAASSQPSTTASGRPSRSAPSTKVARSASSSSGKGKPPRATIAIRGRGASSKRPTGTRKTAPAEARSALAPVGSVQPGESQTDAPNASAQRRSVPTLPGSPTRQRASPSNSLLLGSGWGRAGARKPATTRGG